MTAPIVVPGSANIDSVLRVSRLPGPGETVTGTTFEEVFGGKGANQAMAAARAGAHVTFLSCTAGDQHHALHARKLEGERPQSRRCGRTQKQVHRTRNDLKFTA